MALPDLTRSAVLKAIEEFDQLGRAAFLKKYGFGKARGYRIERRVRPLSESALPASANTTRTERSAFRLG